MAYRPKTMSIPQNIQEPEPYSFPYGFAGGENISVTPDQILPNQSPDMINMNYNAGGKLINRTGFDALNTTWGVHPVRGIYLFRKLSGSDVILVAWNTKIYSFKPSTGAKTDLCTGAKATLTDAATYFFTMGDKCYIYNGTDFCYYDGTNAVADVAGIAYVPTLTINRAPTGGGEIYEDLNYLSNSWKDSFSGTTSATVYTLSYTALTSVDKVWVDGVLKTVTPDYTVDLTAGTVTFGTAPGEGTDNVVIQATKNNLMTKTYITGCKQFKIYGGRNDNRVFAIQNNTRYHSGLNDPTYWPESNFVAITSNEEDLMGMGQMIDYLVLLKERSIKYTYPEDDGSGNVLWPVYPLNDENGCLAKDTIQPVNNGLIFLASDSNGAPKGMVYLAPSLVRGQLNIMPISESINRSFYAAHAGLLNETVADLQAAKSWVYDNKYWLRVGTHCWILDLDWSNFSEGLFVWYPYDGLPINANCFATHEKTLYFGDKTNGIVYKNNAVHADNSVAFTSYWKSPILYTMANEVSRRDWIKKWKSIYMTFTASGPATYTLTVTTEDVSEDITITQEAGIFSFSGFSYASFTYGNANPDFPAGQSEKLGNKGAYLQFKITNATTKEMVLLGIDVYYQLLKKVR